MAIEAMVAVAVAESEATSMLRKPTPNPREWNFQAWSDISKKCVGTLSTTGPEMWIVKTCVFHGTSGGSDTENFRAMTTTTSTTPQRKYLSVIS